MIPNSFFFALALVANFVSAAETAPIQISVDDLDGKYVLTGKLQVPLGKPIKVVGLIVNATHKIDSSGPNVLVQQIDGRATTDKITILAAPSYYAFGEAHGAAMIPKLELGKTYELDCIETGGYVGWTPDEVSTADGYFSYPGRGFHTQLSVFRGKEIPTQSTSLLDFKDRIGVFQGIARNQGDSAVTQGDDWTVIVDANAPWPENIVGKTIETIGMYRPHAAAKRFTLHFGKWRLVKLEDQLGKPVELAGRAFCTSNGVWWFQYRGENLYVDNMKDLPRWNRFNHGQSITIRGRLEKEKLPHIEPQIDMVFEKILEDTFIVRDASWE